MKRHGLRPTLLPLLAGSLALLAAGLASATTAAAPSERPRPENYANYGLYVAALVDYERAQTAAGATRSSRGDQSKICADTRDGSNSQKNSCQGKYLSGQKEPADEGAASASEAEDFFLSRGPAITESLDEAVASAAYDALATAGTGGRARAGMTLQEISADEMASSGVDGLLGMFSNVRVQNLNRSAAPLGAWGLAGGSATLVGTDADGLRLRLEDVMIELDSLDLEVLGNLVSFGNGYGIISADVSLRPDGGLHMDLTSEIYTSLAAVDRDGLPRTEWAGAGALTLDRMAVLIPYLSIDIQGISADFSRDHSVLRLDVYSPGEIYVDFAGSRLGVAAATRDGSWIGPSTTFLQFGPASRLTVASGTRVRTQLSQPDGLYRPLLTLNGRIGDLTLDDIRLIDNKGGGQLRIGHIGVYGLDLIDTRIYVEKNRITVDLGRGMENVGFDLERIWLGSESAGAYVGDLYARGARLTELRMVAVPH